MAQERCIRRCLVYGRSWQAGEVRTIQDHDERGQPIVTDHFRLVEGDEKVDDRDFHDPELVKEKRREAGTRDKRAALTQALNQLDPDDDSHWTARGLPSLSKLHTMTDFEVSRGDVREAYPDFDREFAQGIRLDSKS